MTSVRNQRGMTLIELMIVIVLLGIVVGIAVPSYRNYVLRTHRTDATAALLRVRSSQERFFLQNNRFATAAQLIQAPPAGLGFPVDGGGFPTTENGFYRLAIGPDPDPALPAGTPSFVVTAVATGGQADDADCRTFTISDRGRRDAFNSGGTSTQTIIDTCWR